MSTLYVDNLQPNLGSRVSIPGHVVQVVSATKTDTFSSSATTGQYVNVPGLSVDITPTSATSKMLVMVTLHGSRSGDFPIVAFAVTRNGTLVGAGDISGNRPGVTGSSLVVATDIGSMINTTNNFLDSPATTDSLTYQVQQVNISGLTRTLYTNYGPNQANDAGGARPVSSITVMEIAQ
jgi:hypothetical protein